MTALPSSTDSTVPFSLAIKAPPPRAWRWRDGGRGRSRRPARRRHRPSPRTPGSRRPTIMAIWCLSAWPAPTTDFFTRLAAYSNTGRPARAGASITTPRAWPSFRVEPGLTFTKVSSTAASVGFCSATTAAIASNSSRSRVGQRPSAGTLITPCAHGAAGCPRRRSRPSRSAADRDRGRSVSSPRQAANFARASSDNSKLA